MLIKKVHKYDHIGLTRASRRWGIAPFFIEELKAGKVIDLPEEKANVLIELGYAVKADEVKDKAELSTPEGNYFSQNATPETFGEADPDNIEL
jgi:hypothetical protein